MQEINDSAYTLYLPPKRGKDYGFKKGNIPWNKGMTWEQIGYTEKTKEKILSNLREHAFKPKRKPTKHDCSRCRPVIQMDEYGNRLHWYQSSAHAARKLGITARNIRSVCYGKRHYCGGFRWKFDERFL